MITAALVLDTETSGFSHKGLEDDHPSQGRIMELAWSLVLPDGEIIAQHQTLMNSPGVVPHEKALEVHGITPMMMARWGVEPEWAMGPFMRAVACASCLVAYNLEFDIGMLARELRVLKTDADRLYRPRLRHLCLMRTCADLYYGGTNRKLAEAHETALGTPYVPTHRAAADRDAAVRIFVALNAKGKFD
jgi:DNA polymerase III epsilon subunit-like protein